MSLVAPAQPVAQHHSSCQPVWQRQQSRASCRILVRVEEAHAKLLKAVPWNDSQLAGLDVSRTTGGFHVINGGPGTGKTTMQRSQTVAFVELGMRVLVTCPTNDGADRLTEAYHKAKINAVRYYSASRELKARNLWKEPYVPEYTTADDQVVDLNEYWSFESVVAASKAFGTHKAGAKHMSITKAVLDECDKPAPERRTLNMRFLEKTLTAGDEDKKSDPERMNYPGLGDAADTVHEPDDDETAKTTTKGGDRTGDTVDMWSILAALRQEVLDGTFKWKDLADVAKLYEAFENCKNDLLTTVDVLVMTCTSVQDAKVLRFWNRSSADTKDFFDNDAAREEQSAKPVVCLIDEAMLCQYIVPFMALTAGSTISGAYGENIVGVCFYGDPKQGQPCNLVSKKMNDFPDFGGLFLASCLIKNGLSHVFLNEQRCMHEVIGKFISDKWYGGKLLTSPGRHGKLFDEDPKLFGALCRIAGLNPMTATDSSLRFMYIEVDGIRRKSKTTKSCVVLEAAAYFYSKMYEFLHAVLGDKMREFVAIVCPYSATKNHWLQMIQEQHTEINERRKAAGKPLLGMNHHPRVLSNDSAQGDESRIVIIDGANRDGTTGGCGSLYPQAATRDCAVARRKND